MKRKLEMTILFIILLCFIGACTKNVYQKQIDGKVSGFSVSQIAELSRKYTNRF